MSDPKLFDPDGPTVPLNVSDASDVYEKMLETDGMEFGFNIDVTNKEPGRTLSKEALDSLRSNMAAWVVSRIQRKFRQTGLGAKKIQVHMVVSLDAEYYVPLTDTVPYISATDDITDSSHRRGGKR